MVRRPSQFHVVRTAVNVDKVFLVAWIVLSCATVMPIWAGRYLPLLDLPNHLAAIFIWHHYHDPRFDFAQYYTLNLSPLPYWFHYYTVHLLAYLTGVETANRLFLTAYALGLPLAALALAKRFDRDAYLALFVFPLVWNFNLADGFIAYCAGLVFLFMGLVLVDWNAERLSLARSLAVLAFGTGLYFVHLLPYLLFLVCGTLVAVLQRNPRALPLRLLPIAGSSVLGAWAYVHAGRMHFHVLSGAARRFAYRPLSVNIADVPKRLLNTLSSSQDEWVATVLMVAWLLLMIASLGPRRADTRRSPSIRSYVIEANFVAMAVLYLILPFSMLEPFYWHMINGRIVVPAAMLGVLLVRGAITGWRRWLFLPVVLAGLFYGFAMTRMVINFNRHVAGFDDVVANIPLHRRVLTLSFSPLADPQVTVNCFNQWSSYVQVRGGGYNPYNFDEGFPLRYRSYLPAPPWNNPDAFDYDEQGKAWDYFLTHNEGGRTLLTTPAQEGKLQLVAEASPWRLWKNLNAQPR